MICCIFYCTFDLIFTSQRLPVSRWPLWRGLRVWDGGRRGVVGESPWNASQLQPMHIYILQEARSLNQKQNLEWFLLQVTELRSVAASLAADKKLNFFNSQPTMLTSLICLISYSATRPADIHDMSDMVSTSKGTRLLLQMWFSASRHTHKVWQWFWTLV